MTSAEKFAACLCPLLIYSFGKYFTGISFLGINNLFMRCNIYLPDPVYVISHEDKKKSMYVARSIDFTYLFKAKRSKYTERLNKMCNGKYSKLCRDLASTFFNNKIGSALVV